MSTTTTVMEDPPSEFDYEKILSQQLMNLKFNDRMKIEEELHGVGSRSVDETPEMVKKHLNEFDEELNKRKESDPSLRVLRNVIRISSSTSEKSAKSSCYLNDPEIRLRFLRCELFIVDKAVQKMICFLEFVAELFGDYVADRPIRLSDFTRDEETTLMSSRHSYLPFRDKMGRRVLVALGDLDLLMELRVRFKIFMFLQWITAEDVETQKKGIIIINMPFNEANTENMWEMSIRPKIPKELKFYLAKMYKSLPLRVTSLQHYYPDTAFFRLIAAMYIYTNKDPHFRSMYKLHFGPQTELLYKMSTYGVPTDLIPVSSSSVVKLERQRAWVNVVRIMELDGKKNSDREVVECPRSYDVVFRKGKTYKSNPGNAYYRELIENHSEEHQKGGKKKKMELTMLIINYIESKNGRFLEWMNEINTWVVITDRTVVRKKVASAFKQFYRKDRPRGGREQKKLAKTIEDAKIVAATGNDDQLPDGKLALGEPHPLQEYYSKLPSKRQKTSDCNLFCGSDAPSGFGNACFGKLFHPIDELDSTEGRKK